MAAEEISTKEKSGIKFSKISTASFRGERGDATIRLPSGFPMQEGAQLAATCFVGKLIGEGIQGAVYELVDDQGRPLNLVLKSVRSGGAAWMSNMLPSMEREWAIGQRLRMHCRTPTGLHPGFMRVGAALIVEDKVKKRSNLKFGSGGKGWSGSEEGKSEYKIQGRFRGMIMEKLNGRTLASILGSKRSGIQDVHYLRQALLQVLTALAVAQKLGFRHWDLRMTNIMEHHPPSTAAAQNPSDAGTSDAPPVLSAPESQPLHINSSEDAPEVWTAIELTQSGAQHAADELTKSRQNRYQVASGITTGGSKSAADAGSGEADQDIVWKIIDYGHADFGDKTLQYDGLCIDGPPFDPGDGLPRWMLKSGLPKIPFTEKCYRRFWWRKGDVYRLLMSLQNVIDGSTWPKEDNRRVNELVGLIHHVTGKRITVYFTDEPDQAHQSCTGRFWRRSDGPCHAGRRWQMRLQSFVAPYNPGITATEALALPFFSRQGC